MKKQLTLISATLFIAFFSIVSNAIGTWIKVTLSGASITPRYGNGGGYIPSANRYYVYGGTDGSGSSVTAITGIVSLSNWHSMASVVDPNKGDLYFSGGNYGGSLTFTMWKFSTSNNQWNIANNMPSNKARIGHCMEFDPTGYRFIMHGGYDGSNVLNDYAFYDLTTSQWSPSSTAVGMTEGRYSHGCSVNSVANVFNIFSGIGGSGYRKSDLWRLELSSTNPVWYQVSGGNSGNVYTSFAMKYSINDDLTYFFLGNKQDSSQFWSSVGSIGSNVITYSLSGLGSVGPGGRSSFSKGFNPCTGDFYIFGGDDPGNNLPTDFWKLQIDAPQSQYCPPSPSSSRSSVGTTRLTTTTTITPRPFTTTTIRNVATTTTTTSLNGYQMPSDPTVNFIETVNESTITESIATNTAETSSSSPINSIFILPPLSFNAASSRSTKSSSARAKSPLGNVNNDSFLNQNPYILYAIIGASGLLFLSICFILYRRVSRKWGNGKQQFNQSVNYTTSTNNPPSQTRNERSNWSESMERNNTEMSNGTQTYGMTQMNSTQMTGVTSMTMTVTQINPIRGLALPGYIQRKFDSDLKCTKQLSEGGFGIVYLAEAKCQQLAIFGSTVVVKVAKKKEFNSDDIALFYQEVSLNEYFKDHVNVAKVIGYTEKPYTIIMKYYRLGSLRNWMQSQKSKRGQRKVVLSFGIDISRGVLALHSKGVTHNDLKPENVLLDANPINGIPTLVLTDFGLAQTVTDEIVQVKRFHIMRPNGISLFYASPERFVMEQSGYFDPELELKKDIYPVGVMIFELITGKPPILF